MLKTAFSWALEEDPLLVNGAPPQEPAGAALEDASDVEHGGRLPAP
jgi:hypothetical protein